MDLTRQRNSVSSFGKCIFALFFITSSNAYSKIKITYAVPEGFNPSEMESDARYLATFNGITLPDFIFFSSEESKLRFDGEKYLKNGIDEKYIAVLRKIFDQLDYKECLNGCDLTLADHRVSLDKLKRTITIQDANSDYTVPATHFGLVHNQAIDLSASSDSYRAMNVNGNAWLGLPFQGFGFLSWYANSNQNSHHRSQAGGISSWYMQKNFTSTYLRAGKQNSLDYSSGSVSTLLTPDFDQFVTVGSQVHLLSHPDSGSLVLYATAEGHYEFYRNGRLILKRPAVLGRNEISFSDLPGGYYSVEARLVDHNGQVIKKEVREVNAVNFGNGQNAWSLTAGREMRSRLAMVQASWSRDVTWFFMNTSLIGGKQGKWAAEMNITRPMLLGLVTFVPTLGLLSGEKKKGAYASLTLSSEKLGSLSVSRYQNNEVSHFYQGSASTSISYSQVFKGMTWSYNYQRYASSEQQQIETRWSYRPNGLWASFALGLQKGGYQQSGGNYGIYLNTSWTLNNSQTSFSAARSGGQTQLSGDYRKTVEDDFGETMVGTMVSRFDNNSNINMYASRNGTRGDVSLNVGHSNTTTNGSFNYRGMIAANSDGAALGRYSYSGAAMLLKTPEVKGVDYGFKVEGTPVAGGARYAVPLNTYKDIPYARVSSSSSDVDMNVEVPANILRIHPGQVYSAKAAVELNLLYNGFMKDVHGQPVSGVISQTGDTVHPNGLFSIASKTVLPEVTVDGKRGTFRCDLTKANGNSYPCRPL